MLKSRINLASILLLIVTLPACRVIGKPALTEQNSPEKQIATQTSSFDQRKLIVFAASSLTDAFLEISRDFELSTPGVKVILNFAGSQALRTQLEQGALADIFASASIKEMNALRSQRLISKDMPRIFLTNQLLVILPPGNPGNIYDMKGLSNPGLSIVLAAEDVPVGKYARQVLGKFNTLYGDDFEEKVLSNVVSYENNVKQVVTKVQIGEADAGIVYVSDAVAAPELKTINIPANYNILAEYPISILAGSLQPELAEKYIKYIFSYAGQVVIQKWGFDPINPCRLCVKP